MWTVPANRKLSGKIFFVTCDLAPRRPVFAEPKNAMIVLDSLQYFRRTCEIELFAYVIMPDHVHFISRMAHDVTLPTIVRRFKNFVAKEIGIGPIWNKGYWSQLVGGEGAVEQQMSYIHENPVRAGLVIRIEDWEYSSAREVLSGNYHAVDSRHGYPCTSIEWKTAGGRRQ